MTNNPLSDHSRPASPPPTYATAGAEAAGAADHWRGEGPTLTADEIDRLVNSRHDTPHRVLGPHPTQNRSATVVRAFLPQAVQVILRVTSGARGEQEMRRVHAVGLFQATIPARCGTFDYVLLAREASGATAEIVDPYRFRMASFTAEDERLFTAGRHARLFAKLGARIASRDGIAGVEFAVWAPNAQRVSVVGTFNAWDGRPHQMQRVSASGVWELFIPGIGEGELYKYELKTPNHAVFLKPDLFAVRSESPPNAASIVHDLSKYDWKDTSWIRAGRTAAAQGGIRARLVDFSPAAGGAADAKAAIEAQIEAAARQGYTAVELPAPWSTGEATGLFAFGAPLSAPADVMSLIDVCHDHGLATVLPEVGTSFPAELAELTWYDGTRLLEIEGRKPSPLLFDRRKGEVVSVLLSNALFWIERYHIDALSAQAIADGPRSVPVLRENLERLPGTRIIVRPPVAESTLTSDEIERVVHARHGNPYAILGPHRDAQTSAVVIRAMMPGADEVHVLRVDQPEIVRQMQRIHDDGLFEVRVEGNPFDYRLRTFDGGTAREITDCYALRDFIFTLEDQRLFAEGNHYRIYEKLGAHPRTVGAVAGVTFAVWAPNAEGVSVVGLFNNWDGRSHQMQRHGLSGVWEIFVPGIGEGDIYKFEIRARNGHVFLKTDPYALLTEVPPATASVVQELRNVHVWRDQAWMDKRRSENVWERPIAIYEMHIGSWMRGPDDRRLSYREVAKKLVPYVKALGFTHIELLPIAEHPYEPSWGYQVSNFYAPSSRFGRPEDLMEFVDLCHEGGIGVILDWVPGHFPKDAHALAWFDGTHLYEHDDPRKGEHPDWGTLIFNYGRHEVENFLIANALYWLEHYHFDGLRVDAVASMLYLDYSRPAYGAWIPNVYGGSENLEAIEFLKHTNSILHARFPGIMMIAEESTSWPNVSRPTHTGGLGFGFKWNMGWMHDVLGYMSLPPAERKSHHGKLTFSIMYAFNENFVLSLSHDEVVHLKRSLLNKMPGDEWEKFANLRLLFTYMYAHPGKKLLFMGGELGQDSEWDHSRALEWRSLEKKANRCLLWFIQELNQIYRSEPPLFEADFKTIGFEWLEVDNAEESIVAFLRKAKDPRRSLLFAMNFSDVSRPEHRIGVPYPVSYSEVFNSDAKRFGGLDGSTCGRVVYAEEAPCHGREFSIRLRLPALTAVIYRPAPPTVS